MIPSRRELAIYISDTKVKTALILVTSHSREKQKGTLNNRACLREASANKEVDKRTETQLWSRAGLAFDFRFKMIENMGNTACITSRSVIEAASLRDVFKLKLEELSLPRVI